MEKKEKWIEINEPNYNLNESKNRTWQRNICHPLSNGTFLLCSVRFSRFCFFLWLHKAEVEPFVYSWFHSLQYFCSCWPSRSAEREREHSDSWQIWLLLITSHQHVHFYCDYNCEQVFTYAIQSIYTDTLPHPFCQCSMQSTSRPYALDIIRFIYGQIESMIAVAVLDRICHLFIRINFSAASDIVTNNYETSNVICRGVCHRIVC